VSAKLLHSPRGLLLACPAKSALQNTLDHPDKADITELIEFYRYVESGFRRLALCFKRVPYLNLFYSLRHRASFSDSMPSTKNEDHYMKTSLLITLLTLLLLSACGGGTAGKAPDTPITDDTDGSETQSANGIWGEDVITAEGIDTQLFGIFNEGEFALATLIISEEPVSECVVSFEVNSGILNYSESGCEGDDGGIPLALDTCLDEDNDANGDLYNGFGYRNNFIVIYDSSTNSITVDNYDDANCQQYANSFSISETELVESISGNIMAGTYSIQDDQLDTDSAKLYALNDDFIENGSGTAIVTSASTMMLTAKDGAGATSLEANLLYEDMNDVEVSVDALAGTWEIQDSTCFGSVNFNSCSLSINGTGNISLVTNDCQLEGTINQTVTDNVMALTTSITGDNCASAGQYTGFTTYAGEDINENGESYEEVVMLMSNEQSGFGYSMTRETIP